MIDRLIAGLVANFKFFLYIYQLGSLTLFRSNNYFELYHIKYKVSRANINT